MPPCTGKSLDDWLLGVSADACQGLLAEVAKRLEVVSTRLPWKQSCCKSHGTC
ncbi:MAG: hypothetical protein RIC30_10300 [Marinoscillum sp.]|uniref:hypothetical protein n=1 Tax=Marinoscillum sp. TaxID=2024838 RepID=UPI0032F55C7F